MTKTTESVASVISIPKGGGALSGIGEKFAPELFTGTGNFTVPIALPNGRNGLGPTLSLGYSTGNGNGPFGLGWALNIPGITRKTSRGVPRYDDSDVFLLSGAEDLVIVGSSGNRTQFRPRTEGLFARIERVHDGATDDYWEVATRDGLVSRYGTPAAAGHDPAVIADPASRRKAFSWRLTETTDLFGNRIVYEYARDAASEGSREWDQLYLKRIRYVDFERDGGIDYLISVELYYSFEKNGATLAPWASSIRFRDDPFSDYRSTFEIRTRHRCAMILVHTHADALRPTPVRAYRLTYLDERSDLALADVLPRNSVSLLSRVDVFGYDDEGTAVTELPPLDFSYAAFEPDARRFVAVPDERRSVPSLALPNLELVDLHGAGLPDILELSGGARYWRNLGNGQFASAQAMRESPMGLSLSDAGVALLDVNGDGRTDLMVNRPGLSACFSLEFGPRWRQRPSTGRVTPSFDLQDPEVRLIDLDGDGVTDALRSGLRFECFFNHAEKGWHTATTVPRKRLEEFPDVSLSDSRVRLADMSGDGLQDIVLVHDGNVEYWPNRGRGAWGSRVRMARSPSFPWGYDARRVLVGDLDGDGLADLIYVGRDRVTIWFNRSGNDWSDPLVIPGTPRVTDLDSIRVVDLYGHGTPGLLFSTATDVTGRPAMYFLDLTGGCKPYLLCEMDNNLGATTRVTYASSTRFFLEDESSRTTRWRTPLPFPVQVVSQVEVVDELSQGKLTTEYRYHHGYWDGAEREFRGFGLVEQFDSEGFDAYHASPTHSPAFIAVPRKYFSAPTVTRLWFHQGPVGDEFGVWEEPDHSSEYWFGDPPLLRHTEAVNRFLREPGVRPLTRRERRDALRALRGQLLRSELYASDGSLHEHRPYTVTEIAYSLREESLPAAGSSRQRIFFPHQTAQRATQWERGDDPLTEFSFTSDYDAFGQPRQSTSAAMPRRQSKRRATEGAVVGPIQPDETRVLATHTLTHFATPLANGRYICDRVWQTHAFEPATAVTVVESSPDEVTRVLGDQYTLAVGLHRSYTQALSEWEPGTAVPGALSLIAHTINHYDGAAFEGRDDGRVVFGARTRSEMLVFTDAILDAAYADDGGSRRPEYLGGTAALPAGAPVGFGNTLGYRRQQRAPNSPYQNGYYADSERIQLDFQTNRSLPPGWAAWPSRGSIVGMRDALGNDTRIDLDRYWLLPVRAEDPVGLSVVATYSYRVLQPVSVIDPNGNTTHLRFTAHGLPLKSWVESAPDANGNRVGGTEAKPELAWTYSLVAYLQTRTSGRPQPISVRTSQRVHYASSQVNDEVIETIEYSDGFGRALQKRMHAQTTAFGEQGGDVGLPTAEGAAPNEATGVSDLSRVVVSAWQACNNKGQIVEQHEPQFSQGWAFQRREEAARGSVTQLYYDPRGNLLHTISPNGSQVRVIYARPRQLGALSVDTHDASAVPAGFEPTPWEIQNYDPNDLAPVSVHPSERNADGSPKSLAASAPASHHFTPFSRWIDALGRVICEVQRNGAAPDVDWHLTRSSYDIRGNLTMQRDALGRPAVAYVFDLADRSLRVASIDAGLRTSVVDSLGKLVEYRDSKGAIVLNEFDALNRPTTTWARNNRTAARVSLRERVAYGDRGRRTQTPLDIVDRQAMRELNALGRPIEHWDEAGVERFTRYDLKGNLESKSRRVVSDAVLAALPAGEDWIPDWSAPDRDDRLDVTEYEIDTAYDAMDRPTSVVCPSDVDGQRAVLRPRYSPGGGLESLSLHSTTNAVNGDDYVRFVAYNARGQRVLVEYGNGMMTRYAYDATTFRLTRCRTEARATSAVNVWRGTGDAVHDCTYAFDLAGNLTGAVERATDCGIADGGHARDRLEREFRYDALYRLLYSSGRACQGETEAARRSDLPNCGFYAGGPATVNLRNAPDLTEAYSEDYAYDPAGNLLKLAHRRGGAVQWTRVFGTGGVASDDWRSAPQNRVTSLSLGLTTFLYAYDESGNLTRRNAEQSFVWDHADRMIAFRRQAGAAPTTVARYLHAASGMRVKKWLRDGATTESTVYVDGLYEHHKSPRIPTRGENNTLHVKDGSSRVAVVRRGNARDDDPAPAVTYYLTDHLGGSAVVISGSGAWLNREEFYAYGETSFGGFARKRYRFASKEREPESGLFSIGSRAFLAETARWTSCDRVGPRDHLNLYVYCRNNPVVLDDPTGTQSVTSSDVSGCPDPARPGATPTGEYEYDETAGTSEVMSEPIDDVDFDNVDGFTLLERESPTAGGAGAQLVTFYNSSRRILYMFSIREIPEKFRDSLEAAIRNGDLDSARAVAKQAFDYRNAMRAEAQTQITPSARRLSKIFDPVRDFDERLGAKGGPTPEGYRGLIKSSGKSNVQFRRLAYVGSVGGLVSSVYGVYMSAEALKEAAPEDFLGVFAEETGGWVGGAIGGELGAFIAVGLAPETGGLTVFAYAIAGSMIGGTIGGATGRGVVRGTVSDTLHDISLGALESLRMRLNFLEKGPDPTRWR